MQKSFKPITLAERAADEVVCSESHDDLTYAFLAGEIPEQAFIASLREMHESFMVAICQRDDGRSA